MVQERMDPGTGDYLLHTRANDRHPRRGRLPAEPTR